MGRILSRGTRDNPKFYADYYDVDGTRRTKLLRGVQNKREAKERLSTIEGRVAAGQPGIDSAQRVGVRIGVQTSRQLFDQWLESLQNRNADDDRSRAKLHLIPVWTKVPLEEAQEMTAVMRWLDQMRASEKLSEQSMRHNLNLLSRFFAWAIERGHAKVNPVRMIPQGKRPKSSAGGGSEAPWIRDDETVTKLLAVLPTPVNLMFLLGNRSGMRPGEVAGLRIEDFAWTTEGIIRVAHSYDGPLKEDKHGQGKVKWVPAPAPGDLERTITPWLERRRSEGAKPSDLVFHFKPMKPQNRRRTSTWVGYRKEYVEAKWSDATKTLKLDLTLYEATRHSFVSRNLAAGIPLDEVSAAVGHSSPEITKRFYARYVRKSYSAMIRQELKIF